MHGPPAGVRRRPGPAADALLCCAAARAPPSPLSFYSAPLRAGWCSMFVPAGWPHAVMNLDMTIAVTQNYVSSATFSDAWRHTKASCCLRSLSGGRSVHACLLACKHMLHVAGGTRFGASCG